MQGVLQKPACYAVAPIACNGRSARAGKPVPYARRISLQVLGVHPFEQLGNTLCRNYWFFDRRIHQHKYDSIEGFTKKYEVHRLVYYESYQDVHAAIAREKQVKRWRREKKIALIEKMNPRWRDLAESWAQEMRFRGQSLARTP
jgi:putative endonuclease